MEDNVIIKACKSKLYIIERNIHRTYDPILNSVERQKRTIKNDGSQDDLFRVAKLQGMLNKTVLKTENNKKLKEDGVFGDKTKGAVNSYIWEEGNQGIVFITASLVDDTCKSGNAIR